MKISFKEYEDGLKNEIRVNDKRVGHVEVNIWNQKWKIYPYFSFNSGQQASLHVEYDSFYKAGKAMVNLYKRTLESFEDVGENDTDEFDMRGFINFQKP